MSRFSTDRATLAGMRDEVDELIEAWARERPDLDLGAGRGLQPDHPAGAPPRPGPTRGVHRPRHRVVGVRRARRAAPRGRAVRALAGPAAARDPGDQRHHDQPRRPAGRPRLRRAPPRPRRPARRDRAADPRGQGRRRRRLRALLEAEAALLADLPAPSRTSPACCALLAPFGGPPGRGSRYSSASATSSHSSSRVSRSPATSSSWGAQLGEPVVVLAVPRLPSPR